MRNCGSSWYAAGMTSAPFGLYGSNKSALSARLKNVLSTPKNTSPSGLEVPARIALFNAAPASPDLRICTIALFAVSNSFSTSSLTAKESCETTTSGVVPDETGAAVGAVVGGADMVGALVDGAAVGNAPAHAARALSNTMVVRNKSLFMRNSLNLSLLPPLL